MTNAVAVSQEPDRFPISEMTNLLASINSAMYLCGMPDAAMNALFDAHASVIYEIVNTPSVDYREVESKVAAAKILVDNPDDGQWGAQIAAIGASIGRDMVRFDGRETVLAALAA
ncbi:hypothetical protein [Phyllobacterium zundukense]|uniref:Uncharacterized protein n=1 Tax=Phyllobacterium zundukense TaxID=1867719 RepID=A0ACD4D764_9HYPH|nr:hypothetical protein [Phyllobacterium zundukense]UXN61555.1 hypothetical protein N8E88_15970 [Phyllobacterium zundukense]